MIDRNLKVDYQILIIFGTIILDKLAIERKFKNFYFTKHLFLHYLKKTSEIFHFYSTQYDDLNIMTYI